ncbi:hypothetical protein ARAM_005061 [Aspergillus rambellii]|uniref:Peptidase C14 caspase domain-containing protein n=1 Tax=Aspergillus rambellii TaxID=308745 RepID=A0A0F8WWS5_9EURO|nr:hypothetical protein ARAM_005061 [Aspergillus rambellii]
MLSQKRALLIASPIRGLRGPLNDVETISKVLSRQNFQITRCCGPDATRVGILTAWRDLIDASTDGDAVVIYYSGHGGLVETPKSDADEHWQLQFILPVDYDASTRNDFRGILDIELSHLLHQTTEKTENVTIILDCCHAGRMARHPGHGRRAFPKKILDLQHHDLRQHIERLRQTGELSAELYPLGNPKAVRVMAAAARETAWEYENANGEWTGALTDALSDAIDESRDHTVSWRTTLLRVHELVNIQFPQQHPVAEGPDTRLLFSTQEIASGALVLRMEGDDPVLQGGRVSGVREGNVYSLMPFGHEIPESRFAIGRATVTHLNGFRAKASLSLGSNGDRTDLPPAEPAEGPEYKKPGSPRGGPSRNHTSVPRPSSSSRSRPGSRRRPYVPTPAHADRVPKWILLCYRPRGGGLSKYAHVKVTNIYRDMQLFQAMKSKYRRKLGVLRIFRPGVEQIKFIEVALPAQQGRCIYPTTLTRNQFEPTGNKKVAVVRKNKWPQKDVADWEFQRSSSASARSMNLLTDSKYLLHNFNNPHANEVCMEALKARYAIFRKFGAFCLYLRQGLFHYLLKQDALDWRELPYLAPTALLPPIGEARVFASTPKKVRERIEYIPGVATRSWGLILEEKTGVPQWIKAVKETITIGILACFALAATLFAHNLVPWLGPIAVLIPSIFVLIGFACERL